MLKAKRRRYWFKLEKRERSLLGLALGLRVRLQSPDLIRALVQVLKHLKELGDDLYNAIVNGSRLAWKFSTLAISWGNPKAAAWRNDRSYVVYLGTVFLTGRLLASRGRP